MGLKTPRSADLSRAQLSASQQTFLTFRRRRRRLRSTFTLFWLRGGQKRADQPGLWGCPDPAKQGLKPPLNVRGRGGESPINRAKFRRRAKFSAQSPSSPPDGPGAQHGERRRSNFCFKSIFSERCAHSPCVRSARAQACGSELKTRGKRAAVLFFFFFRLRVKKFEWKWLQSEQERHAVVLSLSGC